MTLRKKVGCHEADFKSEAESVDVQWMHALQCWCAGCILARSYGVTVTLTPMGDYSNGPAK